MGAEVEHFSPPINLQCACGVCVQMERAPSKKMTNKKVRGRGTTWGRRLAVARHAALLTACAPLHVPCRVTSLRCKSLTTTR